MFNKNNGSLEQEILQNQFTAFIITSIQREKLAYLKAQYRRECRICEMEEEHFNLIPDDSDFVSTLCETDALTVAIGKLTNRERQIVISRVINECSFEEIAEELGVKYKGVTAAYYRAIEKLRIYLGGNT